MDKLLIKMQNYADALSKRIIYLESLENKAPNGSLHLRTLKGRTYYSVRTSKNSTSSEQYLSKDDLSAITALAKKRYAKAVLPSLNLNLSAAKAFIKLHSGRTESDAAESVPQPFIEICGDNFARTDATTSTWEKQTWEETPSQEKTPEKHTLRGDMVRSKSEEFIANALFHHGAAYLYEKPLYLRNLDYPLFPDFTILNPITHEEIYWEHFGMMDIPEYATHAIKKLNKYIRGGIVPGKNLICTFETSSQPISSADINTYISERLGSDDDKPFIV